MKNSLPRRRRGGFTLIEVLLVLVILVILASLAVTAYGPIQRRANNNAARTQIGLLKTPLHLYKQNHQMYPPSLEYLWACPPGMDVGQWGGPYLDNPKGELLDPWGRPYLYSVDQGGVTCTVASAGEDGVQNSPDDIYDQLGE
jgi:general secretion pathway protein G